MSNNQTTAASAGSTQPPPKDVYVELLNESLMVLFTFFLQWFVATYLF